MIHDEVPTILFWINNLKPKEIEEWVLPAKEVFDPKQAITELISKHDIITMKNQIVEERKAYLE